MHNALICVVIGVGKENIPVIWKGLRIHCKSMVLRCDETTLCTLMDARLVMPTIPVSRPHRRQYNKDVMQCCCISLVLYLYSDIKLKWAGRMSGGVVLIMNPTTMPPEILEGGDRGRNANIYSNVKKRSLQFHIQTSNKLSP